jgi:hypothetical protein
MTQNDRQEEQGVAAAGGEFTALAPVLPSMEAAAFPSPDVDLPTKRPRPVLGPALILFAALLWAFVVIGTFTTSWLSGGAPLGEGVAIALTALATAGAWVHAVRRSRSVPVQGLRGLMGRSAAVGLLAFVMVGALLALATQVGKASSANVDAYVTMCLLAVVALAALAGHRLATPVRPERTPGRRLAIVAFWVGVAAVTLGACAEIVGES